MAKCKYCGAPIVAKPKHVGDVFYGETKGGFPMTLVAKPHRYGGCKAPIGPLVQKEEPDEAVEYLRGLGILKRDAVTALVGAPKGDVEARIRYALQARDRGGEVNDGKQ